jgi:hypothetical protein
MLTHTLCSACTQLRLVLGEASAVGQPVGRGQAEEMLHVPLTTLPNRALRHDRLDAAFDRVCTHLQALAGERSNA